MRGTCRTAASKSMPSAQASSWPSFVLHWSAVLGALALARWAKSPPPWTLSTRRDLSSLTNTEEHPGMDELKKLIREVPDYPKPGILFYDLTTLLKDKKGFHILIDRLCEHYNSHKIDIVAGIEARGFIFAPALAYRLNAGFVPVRKPKKLPAKCASVSYSLEYGTDTLEIHEDAIKPGDRLNICDDLLATGGTAAASAKLVQQLGGKVEGLAFAVELTFLYGRSKLLGQDVFSLIQYDK